MLDTSKVIKQFQAVHGEKYDYSLVEYINTRKKVKIICSEHGVFSQQSSNHLQGKGCGKCVGKGLTTEDIIKNFQKVHGDRYDYSLVVYVQSKLKVKIVCSEHGLFEQQASNHLQGKGCGKCSGRGLTTEEVIKTFKKVHGDKYDYSKVEYNGNEKKIIIKCPKHGEFEQTPLNHKAGSGCNECGDISRKEKKTNCPKAVIESFKKVHGDRYDYSKVVYVSAKSKVKIICDVHGVFEQVPSGHLHGMGCIECGHDRKALMFKFDDKKIIKQFHKAHGKKYDYSLMDYQSSHVKIIIKCPKHGEFEQTPNKHKSGRGCPSCISCGFDQNKPGILYYLHIKGTDLFKIGVTNRTIEERFKKYDLKKITVVKTWYYERGLDAHKDEQLILKEFKEYQYTGEDILSNGNTELFTHDVLNLHDPMLQIA